MNSKQENIEKRENSLKRAAEMKAAIISLLNNSDEPMARGLISEKLQELIQKLEYKPNNIDNFLYSLSNDQLIKIAGKNPDGQGYTYAGNRYTGPTLERKAKSTPTRKYSKRKSRVSDENLDEKNLQQVSKPKENKRKVVSNKLTTKEEAIAPVTVDIVKSSGRIRIAMGGISIEIGVVD